MRSDPPPTPSGSPFSDRIAFCRTEGFEVSSEAEATANNVQVVPAGEGALQLEMHAGGIDLEISIGADGQIVDFFIDLQRRLRDA